MPTTFDIKVVPSSGQQKLSVDKSGFLKAHLKSPAEKGKANQELIKLLSKKLSIPQAEITIVAGQTSRKKVIRIEPLMTVEKMLEKLGIEVQQTIL